jgi:hypothetical protein
MSGTLVNGACAVNAALSTAPTSRRGVEAGRVFK